MATDTNQSNKKFISRIRLSEDQVYDINTPYSIKFKDGSTGDIKHEWKGDKELTVVIPTVTDLIQNPIEFVGTVDENGVISYTKSGHTAKVGDLLYFLNDCTFDEKPCEAGDMAICTSIENGIQWSVISGEHQVSINNVLPVKDSTATATIGVNATEVLDIEGKKLALKLNMSEIKGNLNTGGDVAISLSNGTATATVGSKYINIETDGTTTATGSCNVPLNDQNVTLANGLTLVKSVTLPSLSGGTLASAVTNKTAIGCIVSGDLTKTVQNNATTGDFVDGVTVGISLLDNNNTENSLKKILTDYTLNPSTTAGETFVKGIKVKGSGETANFVTTTFTDGKATYISSIDDYVSKVEGGSLKYNNADVTELLYGLGAEITDNSKGDVVYDVAVTAPTNVLSSATVDDKGVLSLEGNPLAITPKYKAFTKAIYTPVTPTAGTAPTTGKLTKQEYVFTTGHDTLTTYSPNPTYKYLDVVETITRGSYGVGNISVNIPIGEVVVDVNKGAFPSLTGGKVVPLGDDEKTIGTVSDTLIGQATASVTVDKYKLTTPGQSGNGAIIVGKEGEVKIDDVAVSGTINLGDYYCE